MGDISAYSYSGRLFISSSSEKKVLCLNVMTGNVESRVKLAPSEVEGMACYEGQLLVAVKGKEVKLVVIDINIGESNFPTVILCHI